MRSKAVVVMPTYNEIDNLAHITQAVLDQQPYLSSYDLHLLIVDDNSPDGTGKLAEKLADYNPRIHILHGTKVGLGIAYQRGMLHAVNKLYADVVIQMDADFSHNPDDIPRLLDQIHAGADYAIGSRYVEGGQIPPHWSKLRILNSKVGNWIAHHLGGINGAADATGGFKAIRSSLLNEIDLPSFVTTGYAIQIELLHQADKHDAKIVEVPITFKEREQGSSKLALSDIVEFLLVSTWFRLQSVVSFLPKIFALVLIFMAMGWIYLMAIHGTSTLAQQTTAVVITTISFLYLFQSMFNLHLMLYGWEDSQELIANSAPEEYTDQRHRFTLIVPARDEAGVIGETLKAIDAIDYPSDCLQTIAVCRSDDQSTIQSILNYRQNHPETTVELEIFDGYPINKPHGLNVALKKATGDIVGIFDAEDQPHPDIINVINTTFWKKNADIVQGGVQLMNLNSQWFSTLNVLEYFFWFKSSLHFFAKHHVIPLGGNTVFFKKLWLEAFDGWDQNCLTEDADIGLRMSLHGAKTSVVYDERFVTKEETPDSVKSFVKQRTRWNQGFIQVLLKGDWFKLSTLWKKILALYILLIPEIQALGFIIIPVSIFFAFSLKLPAIVAMLTMIPLILFIVQVIVYNIGLWEFTQAFKRPYNPLMILKVFLTYFPFQLLLGFSAMRGVFRYLIGNFNWEKTDHVNAHRENVSQKKLQLKPAYSQ